MKLNSCLVLFAAVGLFTACNHDSTAPATPPPDPQAAAQAAGDAAAQVRDQFLATVDKKMAELDAKIDRLEAKTASAEGAAQAKAHQALADLRARREALRKEYSELKASSQDSWDKTKADFQSSWNSLIKTYDKTVEKISSS
jgi:Skp family chaperone for outer membrane proteins